MRVDQSKKARLPFSIPSGDSAGRRVSDFPTISDSEFSVSRRYAEEAAREGLLDSGKEEQEEAGDQLALLRREALETQRAREARRAVKEEYRLEERVAKATKTPLSLAAPQLQSMPLELWIWWGQSTNPLFKLVVGQQKLVRRELLECFSGLEKLGLRRISPLQSPNSELEAPEYLAAAPEAADPLEATRSSVYNELFMGHVEAAQYRKSAVAGRMSLADAMVKGMNLKEMERVEELANLEETFDYLDGIEGEDKKALKERRSSKIVEVKGSFAMRLGSAQQVEIKEEDEGIAAEVRESFRQIVQKLSTDLALGEKGSVEDSPEARQSFDESEGKPMQGEENVERDNQYGLKYLVRRNLKVVIEKVSNDFDVEALDNTHDIQQSNEVHIPNRQTIEEEDRKMRREVKKSLKAVMGRLSRNMNIADWSESEIKRVIGVEALRGGEVSLSMEGPSSDLLGFLVSNKLILSKLSLINFDSVVKHSSLALQQVSVKETTGDGPNQVMSPSQIVCQDKEPVRGSVSSSLQQSSMISNERMKEKQLVTDEGINSSGEGEKARSSQPGDISNTSPPLSPSPIDEVGQLEGLRGSEVEALRGISPDGVLPSSQTAYTSGLDSERISSGKASEEKSLQRSTLKFKDGKRSRLTEVIIEGEEKEDSVKSIDSMINNPSTPQPQSPFKKESKHSVKSIECPGEALLSPLPVSPRQLSSPPSEPIVPQKSFQLHRDFLDFIASRNFDKVIADVSLVVGRPRTQPTPELSTPAATTPPQPLNPSQPPQKLRQSTLDFMAYEEEYKMKLMTKMNAIIASRAMKPSDCVKMMRSEMKKMVSQKFISEVKKFGEKELSAIVFLQRFVRKMRPLRALRKSIKYNRLFKEELKVVEKARQSRVSKIGIL